MEWLFRRENSRVRLRIVDRKASLRINGFSMKSNAFALYIEYFSEKLMILLHTFKNLDFGVSEFDTPIEDQTWSGRFVETIRGSDRQSSIGIIDFLWTFVNFLEK